MNRYYLRCFLMLVALATLVAASEETSQVDSITALQARINRAGPGDVIVVKDGVYTTSAPVTIGRQEAHQEALSGAGVVIAAQIPIY